MTDHQIGDAPIETRYRKQMNSVARTLDEAFNGQERPRKVGFVLMIFPFDSTDGRCNYISNADRVDVKVLLREQLARFEGMPTGKGTG